MINYGDVCCTRAWEVLDDRFANAGMSPGLRFFFTGAAAAMWLNSFSILFQFFLNFLTFNPGLALPVSATGRGGQGAEIRKDLLTDQGIFQQFQKHI